MSEACLRPSSLSHLFERFPELKLIGALLEIIPVEIADAICFANSSCSSTTQDREKLDRTTRYSRASAPCSGCPHRSDEQFNSQ